MRTKKLDAGLRRGCHAPASKNARVNLARAAWLTVVLVCAITIVILMLQDYYGYAAVTFAVAASAAINLR